jgi:hypothetical protein
MALTKLTQAMQNLVNWSRAGFRDQAVSMAALKTNKADIRFGNFVISAEEVEQAKTSGPTQQAIFNTWYRFSHSASGIFPAMADELNAWEYNTAESAIKNTTNSGTFIGMASIEKYENYDLEVVMSSTNVDDDVIGTLLAWFKDPVDGKEYTLTALRSPGGMIPLYAIVYNYMQGATGNETYIVPGNEKVTWGNGQPGRLTREEAGYVGNTPGWGNMGAAQNTDGSTRLRIIRKGDVITVRTSQWATPGVLDESTLLTIDLGNNPILQKFRGPSSYGLVSLSQTSSKWEIKIFTNDKDAIFNLTNGQVWAGNAGAWSVDPARKLADLGQNVMLINPTTGKMFLMKDAKNIVQYSGTKVVQQ